MPTNKAKRYLDLTSKIKTRKNEDGTRYIDGMIPYNSRSEEMWGFVEMIDPSAFRKTLADGAEVFAFWAHNEGEVLASRSAKTLTMDNRDEGLHFAIEMRDTAISEDRWLAIERGDVNGVSFGFITEREEWDNTVKPNIRTLKEVRLLEISPGVAFPAYPGAQSAAAVRSLVAETGINPIEFLKPKPAENRESIPLEVTLAPSESPAPEDRLRAELDLIAAECGIIFENKEGSK
ncbi:MAG: HK97 family phage prohead protease [Spirochaetes bacterium]|nr:HK97 family phage prohead protease [Spirochaetota bacterium]